MNGGKASLVVRRWSLANSNPTGAKAPISKVFCGTTEAVPSRQLCPYTTWDGFGERPTTDDRRRASYFETAANCRTVLMKVFVARVRVRSRR